MLKYIKLTIVFLILVCSHSLYAGCGSCEMDVKATSSTNSITIVNEIPTSGRINGTVLASCGMCNFGESATNGCALAIKINNNTYAVKNSGINDHGDSHASNGFCKAVRLANVKGQVRKGKFLATSFALLD